jgi:pimeloyl-ACP methyl ester carboxylesterase
MSELGFHELASPRDAKLDIVFVHGLCENRISTWCSDNGLLWPQKLLSHDISDARILTFGYDADVTKFNLDDELADGRIKTQAADLCERLSGFRARTQSADRPLIFVAHSLGGLVCAQLAVKGTLGAGSDNATVIASNTRGMVFLGTPFHGSAIAPLAGVFGGMYHRSQTQRVKDLEQKSEKLRRLAEPFASVLQQRMRNRSELQVAFFHETKKVHGAMVVPELDSRITGFGDFAPINADHFTMCKFNHPADPGYQSVVSVIKKMVADIDNGTKDTGMSHQYVNTFLGTIKNQVLGKQIIHGGMNFA